MDKMIFVVLLVFLGIGCRSTAALEPSNESKYRGISMPDAQGDLLTSKEFSAVAAVTLAGSTDLDTLKFEPTMVLDSGDLILAVHNETGATVFSVDAGGNVFLSGNTNDRASLDEFSKSLAAKMAPHHD